MIDFLCLLKNSGAYKTFINDKKTGALSHAYLVVSPEKQYLNDYLKVLAKIVACNELEPCLNCRACKAIDADSYADVLSFPKDKESILTADVEALIAESYVKPVENDKKIFILNHAETMNASAQNKLLKTLEEPPKNVIIIMGATTTYPLLSTVLSRVKKVEISEFSDDLIVKALENDCQNKEKLLTAVQSGDGTLGKAKSLYNDANALSVTELVFDVLINMTSSKDVLKYSNKIAKAIDVTEFISGLETVLGELLYLTQGKENLIKNTNHIPLLKSIKGFNNGSILYALEKITESYKRKKFNANPTMLIEWLIFSILEGKFIWQKL
ncbi:MAG: hypothetical protein IKA12_03940 [Clostridia bacterium]|nr:hypothetical protein [Clostridia bacterium]